MAEMGLFYARFMDDFVLLAPTRWKLRRVIRLVNETLADLKLAQHPDKTFLGWICRGFDFLGYPFTPSGLGVAAKTIERFALRLTRLYEQGADRVRTGAYVQHWQRWVTGGLGTRKQDVEVWIDDYRFIDLLWTLSPTSLGCRGYDVPFAHLLQVAHLFRPQGLHLGQFAVDARRVGRWRRARRRCPPPSTPFGTTDVVDIDCPY